MRGFLLAFALPAVMVVGSTALAACGSDPEVAAAPTTVPVTTPSTLRITTPTTAPSTTTTKLVTTTTTAPSTTTTKPPTTTTTAPSTTTTKPPTTTTTAPSTTTTEPVTTTTVPVQKMFGWIRSVEEDADGSITIQFDEAEMLTGTDAITAARNDGVIGPDDELPNDFYIRNPDESTVELKLSAHAVVTLQACYEHGECVTTEEVDVETWLVLIGGEDDPGLDWIWYGAGQLPYEITVDNGVITALDEVYLP